MSGRLCVCAVLCLFSIVCACGGDAAEPEGKEGGASQETELREYIQQALKDGKHPAGEFTVTGECMVLRRMGDMVEAVFTGNFAALGESWLTIGAFESREEVDRAAGTRRRLAPTIRVPGVVQGIQGNMLDVEFSEPFTALGKRLVPWETVEAASILKSETPQTPRAATIAAPKDKPAPEPPKKQVRAGPAFVLVSSGSSRAPIVVFKDAPPYTRRAADDLAEYIEKISGAKPDVIEGTPRPVPRHAIWVGYQPILKDLFPEVDFEFGYPEEIVIAANGKHLVIAGRDRWDPDRLTISGDAFVYGRGTIEGYQQEYGTVNAVYTFLQDHLNVRWLWPGELGTDIIKQKTITFAPFEYRYHPQMRQRHSIFSDLSLYRSGRVGKPQSDWMRFQRTQLDSLYVPSQGHGFGDWYDRFIDKHPEYFALQPDGTRSGFPSSHHAKVCESSPAVWEQWVADVEKHIKRFPFITCFNAAANDNYRHGHCVCKNCRAWDHPDGGTCMFYWKGHSAQGVTLADRQVTFANHLGRLLKKRVPDRDMYVVIAAYGNSRPPPVKAVPDDNVFISLVFNFFQKTWAGGKRKNVNSDIHKQQYKDWSKVAKKHIWRPNLGNIARWRQGGPGDISRAIETFRLVGSESGCMGICMDKIWMYWVTQGPVYYLISKLAWDPGQDGEAVMADYYRRGFGPAADDVAAYWKLLGQARRKIDRDRAAWSEAFTPELFDRAGELLKKAASKVEGGRGVYLERLSYVTAGLDFLRYTTENLELIARLRETKNQDKEAYARAKANWERIEKIGRTYPGALNVNAVKWNIPGHLKDIHPDYYDKEKGQKGNNQEGKI